MIEAHYIERKRKEKKSQRSAAFRAAAGKRRVGLIGQNHPRRNQIRKKVKYGRERENKREKDNQIQRKKGAG